MSLAHGWWNDPDALRAESAKHQTVAAMSRATGVATSTLFDAFRRTGVPFQTTPRAKLHVVSADEGPDDGWLLAALKKAGDEATVDELADMADVSPRRVREALERLGHDGYRIAEDASRVTISRVPVPSHAEHELLFSGDVFRFGIASDLHTSSKHCRLEEIHIAFDRFEAEGIERVFCPGDVVCGRGIFRGQDTEIENHTFEDQVAFAVENLPNPKGMRIDLIGGNHDMEGEFGRAGANAALAVANRLSSWHYRGDYDATFTLPQGTRITMRHPMGGKGYAKSYKPQKFAESFEGGTKPNILILGHYHDAGFFFVRNIQILLAGCFESGGHLGTRVPLGEPAVGFWLVEATIADDGTVAKFAPTFFPLYAGRRAGNSA